MKRTFRFLLIALLTTTLPIRSSLDEVNEKNTDEIIQCYLAPTSLAPSVPLEQKKRSPLSLNLWRELRRVILEDFCGAQGLALKIGSSLLVNNKPCFLNGAKPFVFSAKKLKRLKRLMKLILPILLNDVTRQGIIQFGQYEEKSPFSVKMSKTKSREVKLTFATSGPGLPASHLHNLLNPSGMSPPAPFFILDGGVLGPFYEFLSLETGYGMEEIRREGSLPDKISLELFKSEVEAVLSKENPTVSLLMEMLDEGENPGTGLSEIKNLFGPGKIKVTVTSVWMGDLEADSGIQSGITITLTFHPSIAFSLPDLTASRICDPHL